MAKGNGRRKKKPGRPPNKTKDSLVLRELLSANKALPKKSQLNQKEVLDLLISVQARVTELEQNRSIEIKYVPTHSIGWFEVLLCGWLFIGAVNIGATLATGSRKAEDLLHLKHAA